MAIKNIALSPTMMVSFYLYSVLGVNHFQGASLVLALFEISDLATGNMNFKWLVFIFYLESIRRLSLSHAVRGCTGE
jgi:hypothetical protein